VAVQGPDVRAALATGHKIVDPVERRGIEPGAVLRAVARVEGKRIAPARVEATRIAAGRVVRRQTIADKRVRIIIADKRVMLPTVVARAIQAIVEEPTTARTVAGRTTPEIEAEPTPATGAELMVETAVEATPMRAIEERVVRQITISRREVRPSR
jgi:hypothetical protein